MNDILNEKIKLLPKESGVYVMLDKNNNVIYVGKAKNLKNRVTQYFRNGYKTEKVASMVLNVEDFYYILTLSERDALSLENNLIKKYKPKYNILLKDDKAYPYIKVNLKEPFPTFSVTRKIKKDGAKYFGPFMLGISVNDMLEIVKESYKIRPCTIKIDQNKVKKECLNYHIGLCLSPCSNKCSESEYLERVKKAMDFLSGNDEDAEIILKEKMKMLAESEQFERALIVRDRLNMISKNKEKRITALSRFLTADVISVATDGVFSAITIMFIRSGRTTGVKTFSAEVLSDNIEEKISEFINSYYSENKQIPDEIIVPCALNDSQSLSEMLGEIALKKVKINFAQKGVKSQLLKMAYKNAEEFLQKQVLKIAHKDALTKSACQSLKEKLNLSKYPRRMECYDISHISGVDKVGAMTVFIDGEPAKSLYRKYKIKTVHGNDDFASLKEVLKRRLTRLEIEKDCEVPDLIIIDGGKGQLSSVKQVFDEFNYNIDLISLAEREEEIFTINSSSPVVLPKSDYALKLLIRIRDEAHRFAITFNRSLRNKRTLKSVLQEIDGIGAKKRNLLIDKFKDINKIKTATLEELKSVDGIGEVQAKKIKEFFENGSF